MLLYTKHSHNKCVNEEIVTRFPFKLSQSQVVDDHNSFMEFACLNYVQLQKISLCFSILCNDQIFIYCL